MRLLFFLSSMSSGGAERVCANLANYWVGQGWGIVIVTITGTERDFYYLHPSIRRIGLGLEGGGGNMAKAVIGNWRRLLALKKVLAQERPEISVSFMDRNNVLLALAMGNAIAVGSERTFPPQEPLPWIWSWLRKRYYRKLNAMVSLTGEGAAWLRENTLARSISIIQNPIVWPLPQHQPVVVPPEKIGFRLIAVGRLIPLKQFDLLIEVFAQLSLKHPHWELCIIGDGPDSSRLKECALSCQNTSRVHFPGVVGNLGAWYASSDLYVLTSRYEGFPNTLIEALAHGIPAISFDCDTGPRDILRNGIDGFLVESGNKEALAQALDCLMSNQDLRGQMASKALEARERFSIDCISQKWECIFKELLSANGKCIGREFR